jgi:hypothetical protein
MTTVALRPLALPNEHGAWAMLVEPIALAMVVVPSAAGALLGVAALFAFLARHPMKLVAQDLMRGRRVARTNACELIALGYAVPATGALVAALAIAGASPLLPLAAGLVFAAFQFRLDVNRRGRTLAAELCGASGTAIVAAAIAVAGHAAWPLAVSLAILAGGRALPTTLFVRSLRRRDGSAVTLAAHAAAAVAAVVMWRLQLVPIGAPIAMVLLLARAAFGLWSETPPAPKIIGIREVGWGAAMVALIAFA